MALPLTNHQKRLISSGNRTLEVQKKTTYQTLALIKESLLRNFADMSPDESVSSWLDYAHDDHALPPGILEEAIRRNTRIGAEFEQIQTSREYAPDDINEWDEDTLHLVMNGLLELPRSWFF